MVLVVDIGNTRVKWMHIEGGSSGPRYQFEHHNDLACLVEQPDWHDCAAPERVLISSVLSADEVAGISHWIRERWRCEAEFIRAMPQGFGVINGYADPAQLGADRWAALIAAHHTIPGAACIFDCGTALTVDVLTGDGRHLGGLIMPGLQMMRDVLARKTSALQFTNGSLPGGDLSILAVDTQSAIANGSMLSMVAVIDRIMSRLVEEQGDDIVPVITGGDASTLSPWLERAYQSRPDLVLQGLAIIAGVDV